MTPISRNAALFAALVLALCTPAHAEITQAQAVQLAVDATAGGDQTAQDAEAQLRAAADNGDPWGEEAFGSTLSIRAIVKSEPSYFQEAVQWFRKAATAGLPAGAMSLADAYMEGQGVKRSSTEAARWYKQAANLYQAQAESLQQKLAAPKAQTHVSTTPHLGTLSQFLAVLKLNHPNMSGGEVTAAIHEYERAVAAENLQLQNEVMRQQLNRQ
jgi:TPR repeat protein